MAINIIKKQEVERIPNTYYCVYEETSGLFNLKSTIHHSFTVNGIYHGIGFYSPKSENLYCSFGSLLNKRLVKGSSFYREYSQDPKIRELIQAINNQIPKSLSPCGFTYYEFWNHPAFPAGKNQNKVVDSFIFSSVLFDITFIFADKTRTSVKLSYEEYAFIYDFIVVSFLENLPKMAHQMYFRIISDMGCIEKAIEKGWIR